VAFLLLIYRDLAVSRFANKKTPWKSSLEALGKSFNATLSYEQQLIANY
jgi:hypothetical protein